MQYNTVPPNRVIVSLGENNFVVRAACDVMFDLMLSINPTCSKNAAIRKLSRVLKCRQYL